MMWHLLWLKLICHLISHTVNMSKSFCSKSASVGELMVRYRIQSSAKSRILLIAILLLSSSNIESNPGPPSRTTSNKTKLPTFINFGCLIVRSAVHKAASIHDIIKDFSLDIFA